MAWTSRSAWQAEVCKAPGTSLVVQQQRGARGETEEEPKALKPCAGGRAEQVSATRLVGRERHAEDTRRKRTRLLSCRQYSAVQLLSSTP
jgi:hypothetical protein